MNATCDQCGGPIPVRQHQAPNVRACSPGCAGILYKREHPHVTEVLDGPDEDEETTP